MKLFTSNIDTSNIAQYWDYAYELQGEINSIDQLIELQNPNWSILNQDYYTDSLLLQAGILQLILEQHDQTLEVAVALRVNWLRLHRGLEQHYGENAYLWFNSDNAWPGIQKIYIHQGENKERASQDNNLEPCTTEEARTIAEWLARHNIVLPNNTQLTIWYRQKDVDFFYNVYLFSKTIVDNKVQIVIEPNIILQDDTSTQQENPIFTSKDLILKSGEKIDVELTRCPQGHIVFNNFLEENKKEDPYLSAERRLLTSYKILPKNEILSYYVPSTFVETNNVLEWVWNYDTNFVNATKIVFNLPSASMRVFARTDNNYGLYPTANVQEFSIPAYNVKNNQPEAIIQNINHYIWFSSERTQILHNLYIINDDNGLEDLICDDSCGYFMSNIVNYQVPGYIININNLAQNEKLPLDVYINIV